MPSHRPPSLLDSLLDAIYGAAADAVEDVLYDVQRHGGVSFPTSGVNKAESASTKGRRPSQPPQGRGRRGNAPSNAQSPRRGTVETHYDTLEVSERASQETISAAYRSMAAKWHPDKYTGESEAVKRVVAERMRKLNAAYAVLKDEGKRREYDRARKGGAGK